MKGHAEHRCHFCQHFEKFRVGKIGLLGGALVALHLLWHVAEILVLPTIYLLITHHDVEAAETHLVVDDSITTPHPDLQALRLDLYQTLETYSLSRP